MKALSIRQPWAWEIVQGIKVVEFQKWPTKYRGPFLIHASKTFDKRLDEEKHWLARKGIVIPDVFDRGGFIGIATLTDCVQRTDPSLWRWLIDKLPGGRPPPGIAPGPDSKWFGDLYGFFLTDAQPLPLKSSRGQQGLFNVPDRLYGTQLDI